MPAAEPRDLMEGASTYVEKQKIFQLFEGLMPPVRNNERADFIRRIEPLWGKGSLYEERFIGAWMASDDEYKTATPAELMEKLGLAACGALAGRVYLRGACSAPLRSTPLRT